MSPPTLTPPLLHHILQNNLPHKNLHHITRLHGGTVWVPRAGLTAPKDRIVETHDDVIISIVDGELAVCGR